jgi:asparagine synthase (glutamine-hydrolysing)
MFALAVWDRSEQALHLVRDRIGIKPLHFVEQGGAFCFASEAQALAAALPAPERRIDREALASYLTLGYPPLDRTLFEGVRSVLPGEIVTVHVGGVRRERYWSLPEAADGEPRAAREWEGRFAELWPKVAREHLLSDVPVGLFLSGGMDSAAIAAAVAGASPPVRAFTARFATPRFDESRDALALGARLGIESTALEVEDDGIEAALPLLARHSDTPCSDSSSFGTWLLSRAAAREVKVVLSGDGGDEVFGGYATHQATRLLLGPLGGPLRAASWLLRPLLPAPPPSSAPVGLVQKLVRFLRYARLGPLPAHLRWRSLVDADALRELFPGAAGPFAPFEPLLERHPRQEPMNRALALDLDGYLVQDELVRVDRMSMAHGLEVRVPFLDHRLVELAFRMPAAAKLSRGRGKLPVAAWLQERGLQDVASRPKRGFNHPIAAWLRGGLGARLDERLQASPLAGLLEARTLRRWLAAHRASREDRSYELWNALFLLEWAEAHRLAA